MKYLRNISTSLKAIIRFPRATKHSLDKSAILDMWTPSDNELENIVNDIVGPYVTDQFCISDVWEISWDIRCLLRNHIEKALSETGMLDFLIEPCAIKRFFLLFRLRHNL